MFIKVRRRKNCFMILLEDVTLAFMINYNYIRPFCVVCHTKMAFSVHIFVGLHHVTKRLFFILRKEFENAYLNNNNNWLIN